MGQFTDFFYTSEKSKNMMYVKLSAQTEDEADFFALPYLKEFECRTNESTVQFVGTFLMIMTCCVRLVSRQQISHLHSHLSDKMQTLNGLPIQV